MHCISISEVINFKLFYIWNFCIPVEMLLPFDGLYSSPWMSIRCGHERCKVQVPLGTNFFVNYCSLLTSFTVEYLKNLGGIENWNEVEKEERIGRTSLSLKDKEKIIGTKEIEDMKEVRTWKRSSNWSQKLSTMLLKWRKLSTLIQFKRAIKT